MFQLAVDIPFLCFIAGLAPGAQFLLSLPWSLRMGHMVIVKLQPIWRNVLSRLILSIVLSLGLYSRWCPSLLQDGCFISSVDSCIEEPLSIILCFVIMSADYEYASALTESCSSFNVMVLL